MVLPIACRIWAVEWLYWGEVALSKGCTQERYNTLGDI
ncbi:hypothetical protein BafACA1_P40 (plasmid) [Borreliella afzelii ACA-1]|nr:hypothetical protein BafACA1_P40 [Borreliella afzelii ACA-1]